MVGMVTKSRQREQSCYILQFPKIQRVSEPAKTWQGKCDSDQKSERRLLRTLKVREEELGRDHLIILEQLITPAIAYQGQHRWQGAESIVMEVVAKEKGRIRSMVS